MGASKAATSEKKMKAPQDLRKTVLTGKPVLVVLPKTSRQPVAPVPAQNKVRVFQIYYKPEHRQHLDSAFEPYDNTGDSSPLMEFNVFRKLMKSELVEGTNLWGAVSWKFGEKTGLSGVDLRSEIESNPGHDVYFCNPYPELEGPYHNLWLQGETVHPNFLILAREFFIAVDWPVSHLTEIHPSGIFSAANYFVGTPQFWEKYINFICEALAKAETNLPPAIKEMIYSSAANWSGRHAESTYLPFIIERSLSVFLTTQGAKLKMFKYSVPMRVNKENIHIRLLREMKDTAISGKSNWLATCWINYRNLYFAQAHGQEWIRKHLRSITPGTIKFMSANVMTR